MDTVTNEKTLRQVSKSFTGTHEELFKLIKKLEDTLSDYPRGAGLSAIQIGMPIRVSLIRTRKLLLNLYNPKILDKGHFYIFPNEGCLSIPNVFKDTLRHKTITVQNGDGKMYELKGYQAVVVQHEVDHMNGILFIDHLAPSTNRGEI